MAENTNVVVAGHVCLDILPGLDHYAPGQFQEHFQPGRLLEVGAATFATGGAVSNTGLAFHRLGIPARMMGKVGDDFFGEILRQILGRHAPEEAVAMRVDPGSATSYSIVINPPGADRTFLHFPGANDTFTAEDIPYERLQAASLFHFGYPPVMEKMYQDEGSELVKVFERAKARGVTTSLDMSSPDPTSKAGRADWRAILKAVLPYVDVFLPSIDEILFMLHRDEHAALSRKAGSAGLLGLVDAARLSRLGQELVGMGAGLAVIKLGERGLYLRSAGAQRLARAGRGGPAEASEWAGQEIWAPCFAVEVVGATGSGDATIAGFLSALLKGLSPAEAVRMATAVGACNVEAADALSGIRTWEETRARIAQGWPRAALQLDDAGWVWDEPEKMWRKQG